MTNSHEELLARWRAINEKVDVAQQRETETRTAHQNARSTWAPASKLAHLDAQVATLKAKDERDVIGRELAASLIDSETAAGSEDAMLVDLNGIERDLRSYLDAAAKYDGLARQQRQAAAKRIVDARAAFTRLTVLRREAKLPPPAAIPFGRNQRLASILDAIENRSTPRPKSGGQISKLTREAEILAADLETAARRREAAAKEKQRLEEQRERQRAQNVEEQKRRHAEFADENRKAIDDRRNRAAAYRERVGS